MGLPGTNNGDGGGVLDGQHSEFVAKMSQRYNPTSAGSVATKSYDEISKQMTKVKLDNESYVSKGSRTAKVNAQANVSDKSDRATVDQVLDPKTLKIIFKMIDRKIFDNMNGCMSTGKEANVYHADTENGDYKAIKVYKTSILVFKDRERYVTGEFRFRDGYSKSNSRQMVELWAQKEFRNLNRLNEVGIPSPKPIEVEQNVLVMDFLGDENGWPSPRLRDATIDEDEYPDLYLELLSYMRLLYQQCRLVHADLSEYNILYHNKKLYIIDVSQSVGYDHPHTLEFLRMDIKNVNAYFRRQGVNIFSEQRLFKYIITPSEKKETSESIVEDLKNWDEEEEEEDETDQTVFRSIYIPKTLEEVYDVDRDVELVHQGRANDLIYADLMIKKGQQQDEDAESESGDDEESEEKEWVEKDVNERKFSDRDANKERKKQVKQEAKEKRANKMKKTTKKKLIKQSANKHK